MQPSIFFISGRQFQQPKSLEICLLERIIALKYRFMVDTCLYFLVVTSFIVDFFAL